jgi:heptaprenyl diphosphate synthase
MSTIHEAEVAAATSAGRSVMEWLQDFVGGTHPGLGRGGAVCPFVKPALRAGALALRTVRTGPRPDRVELRRLLRESVREFLTTSWPTSNKSLHSLVVMLPDLDPREGAALDELHRDMKGELVRQRLMFAQFHPHCDERSARNADVKVAMAPVPVLVIRHMAAHDVMFLGDRADWFHVYAAEFGHLYADSVPGDPFLLDCYRTALLKHGEPPS